MEYLGGGGRSRERHGEAFVLNVVGEVQAYPGCLNDFSGFWATGLCLAVLTLILGWLGPVASSLKSKLSTKKAELVESGLESTFGGQLLAAFREGKTWGRMVSPGSGDSKAPKHQNIGKEDMVGTAVTGRTWENYVSGVLDNIYISSGLIVTVS